MPPPQNLLAFRLPGYVCRSCLLTLQTAPRKKVPWRSQSFSTSCKTPKSKPKQKHTSLSKCPPNKASTFKVFEEQPDGTRTEVETEDDSYDESLLAVLDSTIEELDARLLKNNGPEYPSALRKEEALEDVEDFTLDREEILRRMIDESLDPKVLEAMGRPNEEFDSQMRNLGLISELGGRTGRSDAPALDSTNASTKPAGEEQRASKPVLSPPESRQPKGKAIHEMTIPMSEFPRVYHPYIATLVPALNKRLETLKSPSSRKMVWRNYMLCRAGLLSSPNNVPAEFWTRLWKAVDADSSKNNDRIARLFLVGEDMRKAGVKMDVAQNLAYIELRFLHGDRSDAISDWGAIDPTLLVSAGLDREYWELGVTMLSKAGQVDRALKAADTLIKKTDEPGCNRKLIPIMKAYLDQGKESAIHEAWALYVRIRNSLGSSIEMNDYDAIVSALMGANQPNLALRVFKDMMLTGDDANSHLDSTMLPKRVGTTEGEISQAKSVATLSRDHDYKDSVKLPSKFNNRIFFGSWIKKLIGEGELASAKMVLDLMQDRRICPAPIHVNGLIGAWFRSGTEKNRALAEDMAWRMIKNRVDFVRARSSSYQLDSPVRAVTSQSRMEYKASAPSPQATIETFTILLQQYRRRQKPELVSELFNALKNAQIPPNTWFMNELLTMDTKSHNKNKVWQTYANLKDLKGATPNLDTYAILWHNMKKQVDPVIGRKIISASSNIQSCRQLFADMVKQAPNLLKKEPLQRTLYEMIILCFCYAQDQPGTAVALLALRRHFDTFPSEGTGRSVILQLSRLGKVNGVGEGRRFETKGVLNKERIASVTKIMQMFKEERSNCLLEQGIVLDELSTEARLDETLLVLTDLLCYTCQIRNGTDSVLEDACKAAKEMNALDCVPDWKA